MRADKQPDLDRRPPELYTLMEVAQILRKSAKTIYRWIRDGRLRAAKTHPSQGGHWLIAREAIDELLTTMASKKAC